MRQNLGPVALSFAALSLVARRRTQGAAANPSTQRRASLGANASGTWMLALLIAVVALTCTSAVFANQISLNSSDVDTADSSAWYGAPNGQFSAANVLDNQSGAVSEPGQSGYWLAPDGSKQPDYIIINLQQAYRLQDFQLFNTHNSGYNDRGTGLFTITASNNLSDLLGPTSAGTVIASGGLAAVNSANDPIKEQIFGSTDTTDAFQYIRFDANSAVASGHLFSANAVGLNEIRIDAVPEPTSLLMLGLGLGSLAYVARWRRK